MKKKHSIWTIGIIPVLLAVYAFCFSFTALWLGDDITYGYSFQDGSKIHEFSQVISSQIAHYFNSNGRTVAHFLCQLYIPFFGKLLFSISNSVLYVGLLLLMAGLCSVKYDDWKMMAMLACFIVLGFRTKFTPTCQIGYLWMFALVAAFLLVLKKFGDNGRMPWSRWHLLWAAPLSFLAGWSQEALVVGIGAALAVYVVLHFRRVAFSQWVMLSFFVVGALLLCLSPATMGRVEETHAVSSYLSSQVLSLVKTGFYLRITYILLVLALYLLLNRRIPIKKLFACAVFYWIVWGVMLVFNLVIGVFGNRQLFGMEFAAMVIIVKEVQAFILPENQNNKLISTLLLSVLSICCLLVVISNAKFLKHDWLVYNTIDAAYRASDDGVVYYDFSAADVTFIETYPSDVFSWYALETMSRAYGNDRKLSVLPTVCRQLTEAGNGNSWERIASGAIAVIVDKNNPPKSVSMERSLLGRHLSDSPVEITNPFFENEGSKVFVVYEKLPFIKHDSVLFAK